MNAGPRGCAGSDGDMNKRRSRWRSTHHCAYVSKEKVVGRLRHDAMRRQRAETKDGDVEVTLRLSSASWSILSMFLVKS